MSSLLETSRMGLHLFLMVDVKSTRNIKNGFTTFSMTGKVYMQLIYCVWLVKCWLFQNDCVCYADTFQFSLKSYLRLKCLFAMNIFLKMFWFSKNMTRLFWNSKYMFRKLEHEYAEFIDLTYQNKNINASELKTLEWWISRLMLDPLFFLISRLT